MAVIGRFLQWSLRFDPHQFAGSMAESEIPDKARRRTQISRLDAGALRS
jgi:hypothetical protein